MSISEFQQRARGSWCLKKRGYSAMKLRLILVLLLAGCLDSLPSDPSDPGVEVMTDREQYAVEESIRVTIRNASGRSVFLSHCDFRLSMLIERRRGGEWVEEVGINGPICPAAFPSGSVSLAPEERTSEGLTVERAGDYRLKIEVSADGSALGVVSVRSNTFRVAN
jgi:hypothetical protein